VRNHSAQLLDRAHPSWLRGWARAQKLSLGLSGSGFSDSRPRAVPLAPVECQTCASCLCSSSTREPLEETSPIALGVGDATRPVAALSEAVEAAMLERDTRVLAVGDETHFDLGVERRVRLPVGIDVPGQDQARVWFPGEDASPIAGASVVPALVPASS